jgi:hypothetical protein
MYRLANDNNNVDKVDPTARTASAPLDQEDATIRCMPGLPADRMHGFNG